MSKKRPVLRKIATKASIATSPQRMNRANTIVGFLNVCEPLPSNRRPGSPTMTTSMRQARCQQERPDRTRSVGTMPIRSIGHFRRTNTRHPLVPAGVADRPLIPLERTSPDRARVTPPAAGRIVVTSSLPPCGDYPVAAAPGREARGAPARCALSHRRTGGNSQNYPGVSVGLIRTPGSDLSGERVRYD